MSNSLFYPLLLKLNFKPYDSIVTLHYLYSVTIHQKPFKYPTPPSNMANQTYHKKAFYYGEDFAEIYDMFKKVIRNDKAIKSLLPPNKKKVMIKNGIESFAIRLFIKHYVENNKHKLTKKQREKYETTSTDKDMGKNQE